MTTGEQGPRSPVVAVAGAVAGIAAGAVVGIAVGIVVVVAGIAVDTVVGTDFDTSVAQEVAERNSHQPACAVSAIDAWRIDQRWTTGMAYRLERHRRGVVEFRRWSAEGSRQPDHLRDHPVL